MKRELIWGGRLLWSALTAMLLFAAAFASIALTRAGNGLAVLWLPNAFMLSIALLQPKREIPLLLAIGTITTLFVNLMFGHAPPVATGLALANAIDVGAALVLLWRFLRRTAGFHGSTRSPPVHRTCCDSFGFGRAARCRRVGDVYGRLLSSPLGGVYQQRRSRHVDRQSSTWSRSALRTEDSRDWLFALRIGEVANASGAVRCRAGL